MKSKRFICLEGAALLCALTAACFLASASENSASESAAAFEGQIHATLTRDNQTQEWLYTASSNFLRVEPAAASATSPVDILNRSSGELTLVFPHNHSFIRVKAAAHAGAANPSPTAPANLPETPAMPQMPASAAPGLTMAPMPAMPMEKLELRDTNEKTNLLGYACEHFQIQQRGKTMDIWATTQLGAFQAYTRNQPPSMRANMIEEQWDDLLKARHLFPVLAILKSENGFVRFRFEITSIAPQSVPDDNATLFQPPADYHELLPLPF